MGVSADQFSMARAALPAGVRVVEMSSNDAWMRDVGPTFVVDRRGRVRGVDWIFNAWGGRPAASTSTWDLDDQVAAKVLEIERCERYRAPFVLEGGAIHVDGQGTLLTTEECLLNPNRNPMLRRGQIESPARALPRRARRSSGSGAASSRTRPTGTSTTSAASCAPGEVALTWCDDPDDPQYDISHEAYEALANGEDARGRKLEDPQAAAAGSAVHDGSRSRRHRAARAECKPRRGGDRLAGSYVNFYIANRHIVMPLLDPTHGSRARRR